VKIVAQKLLKYPRTRHVRGSRLQHGDHDMEAVPWEELRGKHLVVEEKMDGSNAGISFDDDGTLLLQSRGHYLRGGPREKQFEWLKQWAASRQEELFCILGSRYVLYGENLFAKHTMFYDALPHHFMEFDVLDRESGEFLSTPARAHLIVGASERSTSSPRGPIVPVLVLGEGTFKRLEELEEMIGTSRFVTGDRMVNLDRAARDAGVEASTARKHTDPSSLMEGLYVKWEEDGAVKGRYKFVRSTFTSSILDQEQHWHDRPIIQNGLVLGAAEAMWSDA